MVNTWHRFCNAVTITILTHGLLGENSHKSKESSKLYLLLLMLLLWLLALLSVGRRTSSACLVVRTTVIFSALRTLFVWKQNHSHYAGHLEHCPKVEAISDHYLIPSFLWDKAGDLFMVVGVQLQVVE